jgi:DNA-binding XRE family transcriptional regulator
VEEELLSLPKDMQARFLRISELLQFFGPQHVGMPHVRPLSNKLWEMRLVGREGIGRALYAAASGRRLVARFHQENSETAAAGVGDGSQTSQGDRRMSKRLEATRKKMLADPEVQAAYDALRDEFNLAHELIAARVRAGLTQAQLADKMGTTQSVIARLESGARLPSVKTLLRFAKATHSRPIIKLRAA